MKKGKTRAAAAELAAVLAITAVVFIWGQRAALIARGYRAYGGECLLLLFPALYYIGKRTAADWIAELREIWREKGK